MRLRQKSGEGVVVAGSVDVVDPGDVVDAVKVDVDVDVDVVDDTVTDPHVTNCENSTWLAMVTVITPETPRAPDPVTATLMMEIRGGAVSDIKLSSSPHAPSMVVLVQIPRKYSPVTMGSST